MQCIEFIWTAAGGDREVDIRAEVADVHAGERREREVAEYGTLEGLDLTPDEAAGLREFAPKIEVRPSLGGGYDVEATSWIGTVAMGTLRLRIRPKISIDRVLFLVSYALDPSSWTDDDVPFGEQDTLLEAMAPGFLVLTRRTLARGLRRGYREREEALQTVRGRLRFDDQLRKRFGRFPPAEVSYEEFTEDTPENRILLAAIERLGRLQPRSREIRRGLRRLRARLQGVSLIDYRNRPLPEITFNRLNHHYRPAVRLAALILRNSSIAHESGPVRSSGFLLNMNRVFEDFVYVALREALGLTETSFPQECAGRRLYLDKNRDVQLKPDLSWWREGRPVFVGDVKYKDLEDDSARPSDLYQLVAYLTATGLDRGMLIYADRSNRYYEVQIAGRGKSIEVLGLDLSAGPEELLDRIGSVGSRIVTWPENAGDREQKTLAEVR